MSPVLDFLTSCDEPKTSVTQSQDLIRNKIRILSDSHGRHISTLLQNRCSGKYDVKGFVKPVALLTQILSSINDVVHDMDKNDYLIVYGGTDRK
ncbi:hypothetical protein, partial [Klebsiella pneumoniae]|uniref:hypothetical protein n=1 Tax=Klebsiella pneumoniae TaxID=573 RepID=UPI001C8F70EC